MTLWRNKAEEIQRYADTNESRKLYYSIKAVFGPIRNYVTPLNSTEGRNIEPMG